METKHTPGPWWRDDDGFIVADNGDDYVNVADFDTSDLIDIDEREANKALAIAAPDLLAALETMLTSHDKICAGEDCQMCGIDLARAAIAKAKGE